MSNFSLINFTMIFMQNSTTFINATSLHVNLELTLIHIYTLEISASRVFLGANAQLLGTSLAGARLPFKYIS